MDIIKSEDHQVIQQVHQPGDADVQPNDRWEQGEQQSNQHQQQQVDLSSSSCLNSQQLPTPSSSSTSTSESASPFIGLSKFEAALTATPTTSDKIHSRLVGLDTNSYSLAQSYATIVENYSANCNHHYRRSNVPSSLSSSFPPPSTDTFNNNNSSKQDCNNRLTLPSVDSLSNSLDSANFIRRRNERERARVKNVNEGFDRLRKHLPLSPSQREKRLSKVETLRMAISYIKHLEFILKSSKLKEDLERR